uniref:Mitotic spindle assembly checkpoint protein MAD2B n=1 Tax=Bos taurus TaxID=9913 RepID=A0A3Q1LNF6_BOVIN
MGLSRQEHWSELPFPPAVDLSHPGMEPLSPASPAQAGGFFTAEPPGKRLYKCQLLLRCISREVFSSWEVSGRMTTLTRQDLNFGQVVADVLCEFLEVAVHLILYVREVYPVGIFQKRKKYNVPVQMSCHPELNQYIQDTLHCVKPLLEKNDVEKVVVVILDKEHRPVEKFVFEITQPPLLSISSDSLLSHVEQLLRAFILKISVCDAVLDHNPPGCTFTVLVHTREAATRNMEKIQVIKDFPWILADEQDVHMHDPRLIPLKTMTSDILKMQLYVEERAHKSS